MYYVVWYLRTIVPFLFLSNGNNGTIRTLFSMRQIGRTLSYQTGPAAKLTD